MIEYLPLVLTGIGIIVSILYYTNVLGNANKARQRELILLRAQSYSLDYATAYAEVIGMEDWELVEEFHKKYGRETNPEAFAKWLYIRSVFNFAGLLLKEEGTDPELIFQLYAPPAIIGFWERHEPIIKDVRERFNYSNYWEPFEYLYKEAKRRFPEITYNNRYQFKND